MDEVIKKNKKVSHQLAKIPFTDRAIKGLSGQYVGRPNIPFQVSGNLRGLHLRYNSKTGSKTFYLIGRYKKKTFYHKCGVFLNGSVGTFEIEQYVNEIVKTHKNRNGEWISNPNEEDRRQIIKDEYKYTVREAIQTIAEKNYPKVKEEGSIAEKTIRTYSQQHFGHNERRNYLAYSTEPNGDGKLSLNNEKMTWDRLWKVYQPYKHCTDENERSIYDSTIGALHLEDLTPKIVAKWCNKGNTYGARKNRLKAFQYLFSASNRLGLLPSQDMLDPTRVNHGGVQLIGSKKKVARNVKYNNMSFTKDQLERLIETLWSLRDTYPFQIEAILFMLYSSRRETETLKLTNSMLYRHGDKPDNEVITLDGSITKSRTEEYVIITNGIQQVLDSLKYQRSKPEYAKYKFIDCLFPKAKINSFNCADVAWCKSDKPRYKNIETAWKKVAELTGIDGQKKVFRKTLATLGVKLLGADKTSQITGHKDKTTLQKHYDKPQIDDIKETAQEIAKVYNFKK